LEEEDVAEGLQRRIATVVDEVNRKMSHVPPIPSSAASGPASESGGGQGAASGQGGGNSLPAGEGPGLDGAAPSCVTFPFELTVPDHTDSSWGLDLFQRVLSTRAPLL
jgi:hypothetical protein